MSNNRNKKLQKYSKYAKLQFFKMLLFHLIVVDRDSAVIESVFDYKNCCSDEIGKYNMLTNFYQIKTCIASRICKSYLLFVSGLVPVNTIILEPKICSKRTCIYSPFLPQSTWISSQVIIYKMWRLFLKLWF